MSVSIALAALGVVLSGLSSAFFRDRIRLPEHYWFLGMGALAPAWLVGFLVFLTGLEAAPKELRVYLAGASAAALLGVIGSEYCVRYLKRGHGMRHRVLFWLLGVVALGPSWIVLLGGIAAGR